MNQRFTIGNELSTATAMN